MSYLDDDATPLLQNFNRGSSLRVATRRKVNVHVKPPLPPRPAEFPQGRDLRLRSQSITEGEEIKAPQNLDVTGYDCRVSNQLGRGTQLPYRTIPANPATRPPDDQSDPNRSSVSSHQRNGYRSASLPHRRKSHVGFFLKLSSPLAARRAKTQRVDMLSTDLDDPSDPRLFNHTETSATSYRRPKPQIPPRPAGLPSLHSSNKITPTDEQPRCNFTRYDSMTERKDNHTSQQTTGDLLERSTSVRQHRFQPLPFTLTQAERTYNNTLTSPSTGRKGGRGTEAPLVNHRGMSSDKPREKVRWHSSLPRPAPVRRNSIMEPKTHGRLPSPIGRRETTPTIIATPTTLTPPIPTTPSTNTTSGPFSPRSFRRCQSLNLEVRSPSHVPRGVFSEGSNTGNKYVSGDSYSNRRIGLCISLDSGYSTTSSSSSPSRRNSVMSEGEDDMIEWFDSSLNLEEIGHPKDHFSFLMEKEKEYVQCLKSMLNDYEAMCSKTPSLIRQHFDLIFKQVNIIYQFHLVLQEALKETHGDPQQLARVFTNDQFQYYGRLMVLTPAVQEDLRQFASHIKEHFPDLRRNILKPSLRINFYVMMLDSFMKEASEEAKKEIQAAIAYLNQVKRKANTEMTLRMVAQSPVDLRLGGDMLQIGEFTNVGGGPLQRKKYQLILFEKLLVITSKKMPFFKYKIHYRVEQLESVTSVGDNELHLNVLSEGQKQQVTLKFTTKPQVFRNEWISELQRITKRNTKLNRGRNSITLRTPREQYQMLPLDLRRVFPLVREVVDTELDRAESTSELSFLKMVYHESKYVEQLSATLNPEYSRLPTELSNLLEKLFIVHKKLFLPALKRSQTLSDFLDCLVENLDELSVYVDYLVVRSQLTVELDDTPQAGEYILPVQHLYGVYFGLMKELCNNESCRSKARRVMERLRTHVEAAQVRVQEGAILNGRVDFQRSGKLILYSPLEVKTRKKEIRAGDYTGLLFENVIILTRAKRPYYEYVMDIWLDQANLGRPSNHDSTFRLEVRQGRRKEPIIYEMCATSPEIKRYWQEHLWRQLLAQAVKIRQSWMSDV